MQSDSMKDLVVTALEDQKGQDMVVLDVHHLTSMTDWMVIVSGRSDRHVKSLADAVLDKGREAGIKPIGVEGKQEGEWVLVDFADVLVHVMLPRVREFYSLEKLWDIGPRRESGSAQGS
jgi:ribosome-associated protein